MARYGRWHGAALAAMAYGGVHVVTGNFTLFGAAGIAGAHWCALYAAGVPLGALVVSHVTWDVWIFLIQPTGESLPLIESERSAARHPSRMDAIRFGLGVRAATRTQLDPGRTRPTNRAVGRRPSVVSSEERVGPAAHPVLAELAWSGSITRRAADDQTSLNSPSTVSSPAAPPSPGAPPAPSPPSPAQGHRLTRRPRRRRRPPGPPDTRPWPPSGATPRARSSRS